MPNPVYAYILNIYDLVYLAFMPYQILEVIYSQNICIHINYLYMIMFGWLLWYMKYGRFSNAKSCSYIYVWNSISFQTFFVQAFKIVVDSWKFSLLLLYILWDYWPIFMISHSTATAAIGIHPTKAWLSQLVNLKKCNLDVRKY